MYSPFQLIKKYLSCYIHASNGKGHGIHSPFVFDFVTKVLNDSHPYDCYAAIEQQRRVLLQDDSEIDVEDLGAGSTAINTKKRRVKKIAASSLKPAKYSQLLFRIVQHYRPGTILELGTSLGITSTYLAKGNEAGFVHTCEGAPAIAAIAQKTFAAAGVKNIALTQGNFDATLAPLLQQLGKVDLAFIDGNHREKPTLHYFQLLLQYAGPATIFIFDDIHWSAEMESAWQQVQQHPSVTLTIDLFFIGLVFINPDFKTRQHFSIRF